MKLPNSEFATVDIRKLRDYSLSLTHQKGRHKARMFSSFLGMTSDDADELRDILLKAAKDYEAEPGLKDEYGQRYQIDFPLERKGRHAIIRSAWIIEPDIPYPRLTSCYVLGKK